MGVGNVAVTPRLPPHDAQAEQAVLGGMMLDPRGLETASTMLEPADFYRLEHAALFRALLALHARGTPCDAVTIAEWLEQHKMTDRIKADYVLKIANAVPSAANIRAYCNIVRDKAVLRRAIDFATKLQSDAFEPTGRTTTEIVDEAVRSLMGLHRVARSTEWTINQAATAAWQHAAKASQSADGIVGIPTGIRALDERTGGMHDGDLIVVGARPGIGKTAFGVGVMCHAAKIGHACGMESAEMAHRQIGGRALSLDSGVRASGLRNGRLDDSEWTALSASLLRVGKLPIWIDDDPEPRMRDVRRTARRWKQEYGIKFLLSDYAHRIKADAPMQRETEWLTYIASAHKDIARELEIPVMLLAQIKQEVEQRNERRPTQSDFAGSDGFIREADVAVFLYRDAVYNEPVAYRSHDPAEIIVVKNRHGPTGTVDVTWHRETMRFGDCDNV